MEEDLVVERAVVTLVPAERDGELGGWLVWDSVWFEGELDWLDPDCTLWLRDGVWPAVHSDVVLEFAGAFVSWRPVDDTTATTDEESTLPSDAVDKVMAGGTLVFDDVNEPAVVVVRISEVEGFTVEREFEFDWFGNDGDVEADWSLEDVVGFGDDVSDIPVVDGNVAFGDGNVPVVDGNIAFGEFETIVGGDVGTVEVPATALNWTIIIAIWRNLMSISVENPTGKVTENH